MGKKGGGNRKDWKEEGEKKEKQRGKSKCKSKVGKWGKTGSENIGKNNENKGG